MIVMKRIILSFVICIALLILTGTALASSDQSIFLALNAEMSNSEISAIAEQYGFELGNVQDGLKAVDNEYIIREETTGLLSSRRGTPSPTTEEETYIHIVRGEDSSISELHYFMKDKMVFAHYYATPSANHDAGYFIEDFANLQNMLQREDGFGNLVPVDSAQDVINYVPLTRQPSDEPLVKVFCGMIEKFTEKKFLKFVEANELRILYSGTVKTHGGNLYSIGYSKRYGSSMTAVFSPKGFIIEAGYDDFQAEILTGRSVSFVSSIQPKYYNVSEPQKGFYVRQESSQFGGYSPATYTHCSSGAGAIEMMLKE